MMTNTPNLDTQVLIDRARDGDRDAYDRLFEQAAQRLLLYVRLRLGGELRQAVASQDVLQETYLHAHRDFSGFEHRGRGAFAGWLCAIARNRIRDLAEMQGTARRKPRGKEERLSVILEHVEGARAPASTLARREARKQVEEAVQELEGELKEVVLLRFFEGVTIDGISKQLDLPPTTVRRRLGQALVILGGTLDGLGEECA